MSSTKTQAQHLTPRDLESGTPHADEEQPTERVHAKQQPNTDTAHDDSDGNDKFWTLFQKEATSEAQYKVSIWKTELDSLLVFAGLFAAVVSAFLIDLRSRLSPDPQLTRQIDALTEIASILRNDTAPANSDLEKPPRSVLIAGYLWYGSLVVTLIGALSGVLAQRWLGAFLREIPNNPAEQALERWRRDKAARHWYMGNVITGVPLLTQLALGMFLTGFVFQSLDDNHAIGIGVGALVGLGFFAYIVVTFLPWFRSDCPFQTPITQLLHLVHTKENHDTNTDSKIEILASRLTRSSNDEIFCAAASMLDVKLESDDAKKWYNGIEKQASKITDALSARITSFAHQVQTIIAEGPSLSILKNTTSSGTNREAFVGALYSPIDQGVTCLRVVLNCIEASMLDGVKSPWIKQAIDRQWRSSKTFPEAWRLLSWSTDITGLVAKRADYDTNDIVAIDWDNMINMIRKTFPDLTLRSILGVSASRGLSHGKQNVKRVSALGLAMILEIEATTTSSKSSEQTFFDKDFALYKGKDIMEGVWNELEKIWKNTVDPVLCLTNRFEKIMTNKLYQPEINSSIAIIIKKLDHENWELRKQTTQILGKLSELEPFQQTLKTEGVVPKLVSKLLEDDHSEFHAIVFAALQSFSKHKLYQSDIESSIPIITQQLEHENWERWQQIIHIIVKLFELEVVRPLKIEGIIPKLITKLEDDDPDVRAAVFSTLQAFSEYELYRPDIEPSIPTIIGQLDHKDRELCKQTAKILVHLSGNKTFRMPLQGAGIIPKLVAKLKDDHSDIRTAVFAALQTIIENKLYQLDVNLSIPVIIGQLNHENWALCKQTARILLMLSEIGSFQQTLKTEGIITKLVAVIAAPRAFIEHPHYRRRNFDSLSWFFGKTATSPRSTRIRFIRADYVDVCNTVVAALQALSKHDLHLPDIERSVRTIIEQLTDDNSELGEQSVRTLIRLSQSEMFRRPLKIEGIIPELVAKFEKEDADVHTAVIATLKAFCPNNLYHSDINSSIPIIRKKLDHNDWQLRAQVVGIFATFSKHDVYQEMIRSNGIITKLIAMLKDDHIAVRAAAVRALSALGTQPFFMETMKLENAVSSLIDRLLDNNDGVRSTVREAIFGLCEHEIYIKELVSVLTIPTIIKQIRDDNWRTRQTAVKVLSKLATNVDFQEAINTEKTVLKLMNVLMSDDDADVCIATAQALLVFGTEEFFQKELKSEKAIRQLTAKLADSSSTIRSAAESTILGLSEQEYYHEDIKSAIPTIMIRLEDQDWAVRKLVIKMIVKLHENPPYQEALKTEELVIKLIAKMEDHDKSVRFEAVQAFSAILGANGIFQEMTKVVPKLVTKLTDRNERVRISVCDVLSALGKLGGTTGFVQTIVSTLNTVDMQARKEVYKLLVELTKTPSNPGFRAEIDMAICNILAQLTDKGLNVILLSISILAETAEEGLIGDGLKSPTPTNKPARDTVETIVRSKLVYDKNSPDRGDVVLALSCLAKHEIFLGCLKPAILGLTEALSNSDRKVWSVAVGAISALSKKPKLCELLVPALEKLIQQLSVWDYPINLTSNSQNVLIEDLFTFISNLGTSGNLTMNHRIALASALRIASPASTSLEIRVWKLEIAALLKPTKPFSDEDCHSFFSAVFGTGNDSIKSKLSTLFVQAA